MQFTQSCLTLCDPMDCITPGFPVHHQLLELVQTHVHRGGDAQKWDIAIKKELKHARMLLNLDVDGTWMDAEKEMKTQWVSWHCTQKPDGPWRGYRCRLLSKRRNWHWNMGGRDSCYEAAESKSMRGISYERKKKALLNIKEPGLTGFNAVSPLQHLHLSNCHMMQKDRNGFWARIKPRVLPGKHGLKVEPVDCKTLH